MTAIPSMVPIHLTTGKEIHRDQSAVVGAFLHNAGQEVPLFVAAKNSNDLKPVLRGKVSALGQQQFIQARNGVATEIGGQWVSANYQIAEGSMLKLSITKSTLGNRRACMVMLFVRPTAALRRLVVPLGLNRFSTVQSAVVEGRFDVMGWEEFTRRGASMSPVFQGMFESIVGNTLYRVEEIEPELEPLPRIVAETVQLDTGETAVVQTRARRRNLDV